MNIKFRNIVAVLILILTFPYKAQTQEGTDVKYPKVGETIQDHIFTDLYNYPDSTLKLSDLKGKWIILDIWSRSCGGCIGSFPKMDSLAERFKNQVKLIMVGSYSNKNNSYQKTKEIYEYHRQLHNLKFTVALDSSISNKYDVQFVPMILVINPEGIIVAKTTSVKEKQVINLLEGKPVYFSRAFSGHEKIEYDNNLPFLTTGSYANGGVDTSFTFRSLLSPYDYNVPLLFENLREDMVNSNKALKTGRFEVTKQSLEKLLLLAYFGQSGVEIYNPYREAFSPKIVLENKNASIFNVDETTLQGLYSYSLTVPKERISIAYLKQIMQQDLCRYFDIDVSIEERLMPVYELKIVDNGKVALLKTKGKEPTFYYGQNEYGRFRFENQDFSELVFQISNSISGRKMPLIDKTGIDYKVDIDMKADPYSLESFNKGLAKYGLKVIVAKERLKTIVVRDQGIKEG